MEHTTRTKRVTPKTPLRNRACRIVGSGLLWFLKTRATISFQRNNYIAIKSQKKSTRGTKPDYGVVERFRGNNVTSIFVEAACTLRDRTISVKARPFRGIKIRLMKNNGRKKVNKNEVNYFLSLSRGGIQSSSVVREGKSSDD